VQALALARLARPRPALLIRRRQGVPRQLAARPHQSRPAPKIHIDPKRVPAEQRFDIFDVDIDAIIRKAVDLRERLATEIDEDDPVTASLRQIADGVVAAGLREGGRSGTAIDETYADLRQAVTQAHPPPGVSIPSSRWVDSIINRGLTPSVETDYERWKPLHWVLEAPDVCIQNGGFDAIIGNPPFLGGQKLSGALGTEMRDWFVEVLANGVRGSADLVAYFFLRGFSLLAGSGTIGLIATNTIAQGDTREVGLEQMMDQGFTILRSIQSRSWPSATANLEFAAVWGTRAVVSAAVPRVSDNVLASSISSLLEPGGRVTGSPKALIENEGVAFIGCYVLGLGFVVEPDEANEWMEMEPSVSEVLLPYLNGEDLNSRPDLSASRWVIDFGQMDEAEASQYRVPFERVRSEVYPQRRVLKIAYRRDYWWRFAAWAASMRAAIADLEHVVVLARVSKTLMPVRVRTGLVFSDQIVVFGTDSYAEQAVLSASPHQIWAIKYGSGMRNDPRYTPSDVFETFPRPTSTQWLAAVGRTLDAERREIMIHRDLGLTKLYNLVNDSATHRSGFRLGRRPAARECTSSSTRPSWTRTAGPTFSLDHGFHTYRQMERWTVSPACASRDPRSDCWRRTIVGPPPRSRS
jgi:hypothetical protein